ncbi:MAG: NAD(P)-dependent oxidoreductase [Chthoniobacterales bacterium]
MNLLLTGATGFVGRNTLLTALRAGRYEKIFVPVRDEAKLRSQFAAEGFPSLPENLILLKGSSAFEAPPIFCEEVIHCAGVLFARDAEGYRAVNVDATVKLLEQLSPSSRIILVSSQSAGGAAPSGSLARNEADADVPLTCYGQSKCEMEHTVMTRFPEKSVVALRPPMILGPRDTATLPLFKMATSAIRMKPALHTKFYSWVAVDDLVAAFFKVLDDSSIWSGEGMQKFYVASPETITDRILIDTAAQAIGKTGITLPLPQPLLRLIAMLVDVIPPLRNQLPSLGRDRVREIWPSRMVVDATAFRERFRWNAKKSLAETLSDTWQWYRADSATRSTKG